MIRDTKPSAGGRTRKSRIKNQEEQTHEKEFILIEKTITQVFQTPDIYISIAGSTPRGWPEDGVMLIPRSRFAGAGFKTP